MNILITGSSTIIGSRCIEHFFNAGYSLILIDSLPEKRADLSALLDHKIGNREIDLVILAEGEDVIRGIKTSSGLRQKKDQLLNKNSLILEYLKNREIRPKTVMLSSSVLIYENDKNGVISLDESASLAESSAADYYKKLETSATELANGDMRIIHLRLGKIVSKLIEPSEIRLPLTKKIIPAPVGLYQHKMSWVSQEDAVRAIIYLCENVEISGPVNITSGAFVPLADYYNMVEKRFGLRKSPPVPRGILTILIGNELNEHVCNFIQAVPGKLIKAGFLFNDISIEEYLNDVDYSG